MTFLLQEVSTQSRVLIQEIDTDDNATGEPPQQLPEQQHPDNNNGAAAATTNNDNASSPLPSARLSQLSPEQLLQVLENLNSTTAIATTAVNTEHQERGVLMLSRILREAVLLQSVHQQALDDLCEYHWGTTTTLRACLLLLEEAHNNPKSSSSPTTLEQVLRILKRILLSTPSTTTSWWVDQVLQGIDHDHEDEDDTNHVTRILTLWIDVILRVPLRIANACQQSLPLWAVPERFGTRLVWVSCKRVVAAGPTNNHSHHVAFLSLLIEHLIRRGQVDCVAQGMYKHFCVHTEADDGGVLCVLTGLPSRYQAQLCFRFAQLPQQNKSIDALLCRPLLQDELVLDAFTHFILNAIGTRRTAQRIVQVVTAVDGMVETLSVSWGSETWIRSTSAAAQHWISGCLVEAIPKATLNDDTIANLMQGIGERLQLTTSSPEVRKDGMRVGEQLALKLGHEMRFDELNDERDATAVSQPVVDDIVVAKANPTPAVASRPRRIKSSSLEDPNADVVSESGSDVGKHDDDSVWSDQSLEPYDLEDDEEDLRETPKPMYLSDCLDLLRTPETDEHAYSRHRTALETLPELVKSRPMDQVDLASALATQVLRLENKFHMDDFLEKLMVPLVALTTQEPLSVGTAIIADLFDDNGSLTNRLMVLDVLSQSAYALSGREMMIGQESGRLDNTKMLRHQSPNQAGENLAILSQKTRRWRTRPPEISAKPNEFAHVAPAWFYLLAGHVLQTKDSVSLWSGHIGSTLLAQVFTTLAVFVETSGHTPGTEVLARDLFELVWGFRRAEIADVRAAVLCAIASSLGSLQEESLLELLVSRSVADGLPEYIEASATMEPDDRCREIAQRLSSSISQTFKAIAM